MSQIFDGRQLLLWIELIGCLVCFNLVQGAQENICTTAECKVTSQNFYGHVNFTADPCDDFYEYACGNWFKNHPMPGFANHWSTRSVMRMTMMKDLRKLLESKEKRSDDKHIVQAKRVYKVCMNIPRIDDSDFATLKGYVQKFDTSPLFVNNLQTTSSWWMVDNYYLKISGESAFFDVSVIADVEGDMEPILHISMLTSAFGNVIRKSPWTKFELTNYTYFLRSIMRMLLTPSGSKQALDLIEEDMNELLNLRNKIEEIKLKTLEQKSACVRMTIGKFQKMYDQEAKSKIDWVEHARVLLRNNMGDKAVKSTPIYVCDEYYFRELAKLLHAEIKRTIVNHIHLYFVERNLILEGKPKSFLQNSISGGISPTGVLRIDPERWYSCIDNSNMRRALGKIYFKSDFAPAVSRPMKTELERIVDGVKDAIVSQIDEAKWVEKGVKREAKYKIEASQIVFGSPDLYDSTLQPSMDPLDVKAYNSLQRNVIVVSQAIMQPPIFSLSLAYVVEYGTMGFTLGHELYHGLTGNGLQYNSQGKKKLWWPNTMQDVYDAKQRCFIEEYSKYRVIELEKELEEIYNNGRRTAAENMADTMGLKAAYRAFRKRLEKMKDECPILPHFAKSTCEQLFFISFANTLCSTMRPYTLYKYVRKNQHSTPRTRVNAAVANMPEFSRAFKCERRSPLNPAKKCDLWH